MLILQDEPTVSDALFEDLEREIPVMPEEPAALRRRVLGLAWPVIGENLLETLLGIVDTALVAGLGTAAIAGVGTGLQIMFFLLAALSALSVGSSILVAQAIGFAGPIMHLFTQLPDVARIGAAGLRIVALTQPFWAVGMVQSGALRGTGDTRTPLAISTVGMWTTVLLVWLGLTFLGGGLVTVWGAFLLTSPITDGVSWLRFRHRVRTLELEAA